MKNYKNLFLVLISLGISMQMITAMHEGYTEPERDYKASEGSTKYTDHNAINVPESIKNGQTPRPVSVDINYSSDVNRTPPKSEAANLEINLAPESTPQSSKPTPTDILIDTLQRSTSYKDALKKLNDNLQQFDTLKVQVDPAGKLRVQQARTLLVRAHPEVVPGLALTLAYLPNRFVSYFKEMRPRLTTYAGKQRFTQSVMMEALKAMPKLESAEFNDQLNNISKKYSIDLDTLMQDKNSIALQARLVAQWSRNMITELALLAPRTAGATIGATAGAISGMSINYGDPAFPSNPVSGALQFGTAGAQAGEYLARSTANAVGQGTRYVGGSAREGYNQITKPRLTAKNLTENSSSTSSPSVSIGDADLDISDLNSEDSANYDILSRFSSDSQDPHNFI